MFGFPEREYKTFKKNFLKTVVFQIKFKENTDCEKKKSEIIDIFKPQFPRFNQNVTKGFQISFKENEQTPVLQTINDGSGLEMKSEDGQKIIFINSSSFSYTISGTVYKNHFSLKDDLQNFQRFISLCNIKTVDKIANRKINVIEFKINENPSDVLGFIISPELLSNLSYFPNSELINQNIHSISYTSEEYKLNLKYGLNVPPLPNKDLGHVVIDIDLINKVKKNSSEIFTELEKINSQIFSIFTWATNNDFLKLLNE